MCSRALVILANSLVGWFGGRSRSSQATPPAKRVLRGRVSAKRREKIRMSTSGRDTLCRNDIKMDAMFSLVLALVILPTPAAATENSSFLYLSQEICVDANGNVYSDDPISCRSGTTPQPIGTGQKLPYYRIDQIGQQRHDSFPVESANGVTKGRTVFLNPFIFNIGSAQAPNYSAFSTWAGDGYDLYEIKNSLVSAGETRDGGGFSQTFCGLYDGGTGPYNGWVFFPETFLSANSAGSDSAGTFSIYDDYWELSGISWSQACSTSPTSYSQTITSWNYLTGFSFGGINGNPTKTLNTLQAIAVYYSSDPDSGHLEVFYFTEAYGITRWEVWTPIQENPTAQQGQCNGTTTWSYRGNTYIVTACRDWSAVVMQSPAAPPVTPLPDLNLVSDFHFDSGIGGWKCAGNGSEGPISCSLQVSKHVLDTINGSGGVRYLATDCGGNCNSGEEIYQDIPVSGNFQNALTYAYGATVRSENSVGQEIQISVSQVNSNHSVIAGAPVYSFTATVQNTEQTYCGTAPSSSCDSLVLASNFYSSTAALSLNRNAAYIRVSLEPLTTDTFDIFDFWVMPYNFK